MEGVVVVWIAEGRDKFESRGRLYSRGAVASGQAPRLAGTRRGGVAG